VIVRTFQGHGDSGIDGEGGLLSRKFFTGGKAMVIVAAFHAFDRGRREAPAHPAVLMQAASHRVGRPLACIQPSVQANELPPRGKVSAVQGQYATGPVC